MGAKDPAVSGAGAGLGGAAGGALASDSGVGPVEETRAGRDGGGRRRTSAPCPPWATTPINWTASLSIS